MSEHLIVATFHDCDAAYRAASAIKSLNETASADLTVKAGVIVHKDDRGHIHLLGENTRLVLGTAVGTLSGALVGLIAGAAGATVGAALGAIAGATLDATPAGLDADFVESVKTQMSAGTTAIIVEADEKSTRPIDDIVASKGGQLHRQEVKPSILDIAFHAQHFD